MTTAIDLTTAQGQEEFASVLVAKLKPAVPAAPPGWHGGTAVVLGIAIVASLVFISRNLDILSSVIESNKLGKPQFAWSSMGLLGQISLRILAIYFGAAAMLAGTATAFYSTAERTTASGEGKGLQLALATASPGIAAVAAGAIVICVAVTATIHARYGSDEQPVEVGASESRKSTLRSLEEVLRADAPGKGSP